MVLPERPELAFRPHNLQSNQMSTPESIALYDAAARASAAEVKTQLAAGGNPNWYNNPAGGATALHAAAKAEGQQAATVINLLLDAGASPTVVTLPESNTPLHLAAFHGNLEGVKAMVEHKEGPGLVNRPNAYGNTPLHQAAVGAHGDVVKYLLSKGADVNTLNKRGSTCLLFAIYADRAAVPVLTMLVEAGADPSKTDEDGVGALHVAAIKGHEDVVRYLLDNGVVPLPDSTNSTPAYYAQAKGFDALVPLLQTVEEKAAAQGAATQQA